MFLIIDQQFEADNSSTHFLINLNIIVVSIAVDFQEDRGYKLKNKSRSANFSIYNICKVRNIYEPSFQINDSLSIGTGTNYSMCSVRTHGIDEADKDEWREISILILEREMNFRDSRPLFRIVLENSHQLPVLRLLAFTENPN